MFSYSIEFSLVDADDKGLGYLTFNVTGDRSPKGGGNLPAWLAGCPVDGGIGHTANSYVLMHGGAPQ